MRGKTLCAMLVFLILFGSLAAAQEGNIVIRKTTVDNSDLVKIPTDIARYRINITNNLDHPDHFRILFQDEDLWTILTEPEIYYKTTGFDLDAGESIEMYFSIRPRLKAIESYDLIVNRLYEVRFEVLAEDEQLSQEDSVMLYYGPDIKKPTYPAVVLAEIDMQEGIDPRLPLEIRVILENKNPLNISALDIYLQSELVSQHQVVDLQPLEKKTVLIRQPLDPLQPPQTDTLNVTIVYEGATIETQKMEYDIIAYSQFEEKSWKEMEVFYKSITYLSFRNNGNVEKTETVKTPISVFGTLFLTSEPKASIIQEDGKSYLSWQMDLAPNETKTVKLVNNYLPLLIILALIILALIVARLMKGSLTVQKHAMLLSKKEGGIAGVKVILKIKNISSKPVHEVEIVDSVPNIVEIDKKVEMGHMPPTNIVDRGSMGILIKWKLGDIEPGEERVVSYKARARLTILGSFTLPAAVLRCIQSYKEKLVYSNRLRIKL